MAQMKVGHPAFVGDFRVSPLITFQCKLYPTNFTDSLSTFSGEDQIELFVAGLVRVDSVFAVIQAIDQSAEHA